MRNFMIPMTNLKQIGDGTSKVFSCSKAYIECFRSRHESICIVISPVLSKMCTTLAVLALY
jgi:hypothetical protein